MWRYLRIAFLAGCLMSCLLLIGLRVQSQFNYDALEMTTSTRILQLRSRAGRIEFWLYDPIRGRPATSLEQARMWVNHMSNGQPFRSNLLQHDYWRRIPPGVLGFGWQNTPFETSLFAPYWFLILLSAILAAVAAAPEVQWTKRFSLRTLFIAITLLALLLGAVNYVAS